MRRPSATDKRYAADPVAYRLDELARLALDYGLESRRVEDNRLDIVLAPEVVLSFCNLAAEGDSLLGFCGNPWHAHGVVQFMTGTDTYAEYDELEILVGLANEVLLVASQHLHGELQDRWLVHRCEPLDLRHMEAGEELRLQSIATTG